MLNVWNRAEHYRDLAAECRRLAGFSFSSQMRSRYSHMASQYGLQAEAEEVGNTSLRRLAARVMATENTNDARNRRQRQGPVP